jgi:hypothetical protein
MRRKSFSRRSFLTGSGAFIGGTWFALHWPVTDATARAAAAAHARREKFSNLSAEQAADLEAIAAQIIPGGDTPGAREAGVVYFIDAALGSFAAGAKVALLAGLDDLHRRLRPEHGADARFSAVDNDRQIDMLRAIEDTPFFGLIRYLTVAGMFSMPSYGGNRDGTGWQLVGFEDRHHWQPPFGWYDARLGNGEADG